MSKTVKQPTLPPRHTGYKAVTGGRTAEFIKGKNEGKLPKPPEGGGGGSQPIRSRSNG